MKKKTVIARIQVKEEKVNEYLEIVSPLITATRNEPGNLEYTLYKSTENPAQFLIYEEYVDDNAFKIHGDSEAFKTFASKIEPLLAKELDIQVY